MPIRWNGNTPQQQPLVVAERQDQEVKEEMRQLLKDGAFVAASSEDTVVSPVFLIPKRTGGTRLIHDLRAINAHIAAPHFTIRGARDAANVVRDSNWLCALDLKRGYQQVYMDKISRRYLGAKVGGQIVESAVLPFGLSLSPYVFTRLTNWVAGLVRRKTGLRVAVYIDDFLVGANSREEMEVGLNIIKNLFQELGIVLSDKKPMEISRETEFLGFEWSAEHKTVGVTETRRKEFRRVVKNLLRGPQPITRWKTTIGKLVFLREAIGPTLRHVRSLMKTIRGKRRGARISAEGEARSDLLWWYETLGSTRQMCLVCTEVSASVTTDASDVAIGYVVESRDSKIQGSMEVENKEASINARELEALLRCLESNGEMLENKHVLWYSDNVTALAAVRRQGTQHLNNTTWEVTKRILDLLEERNIKILPRYVPGALNRQADALSRPDQEEEAWKGAIRRIVERWGPLEKDPFGMTRTSTGPVEDLSWADKRTLLKPPTNRIADVLDLVSLVLDGEKRDAPVSLWRSCAVLITPTWRQAIWWNKLEAVRTDWLDLGRLPDRTLAGWESRNNHPSAWTASLIQTKGSCGPLGQETNMDA